MTEPAARKAAIYCEAIVVNITDGDPLKANVYGVYKFNEFMDEMASHELEDTAMLLAGPLDIDQALQLSENVVAFLNKLGMNAVMVDGADD